jgi:hypothetical protein
LLFELHLTLIIAHHYTQFVNSIADKGFMKRLVTVLLIYTLLTGCYWAFEDDDVERSASPENLIASIETDTEGKRFIRLHWIDNSTNESGFNIARGIGTGMYWVIQSVAANTTTYDDYPPNTNYGTTYRYKVRSFTNYYYSEYSNEVVITFK